MMEEWNDFQAYSNDARSAGSLDDSHSRPSAQPDQRGGVSGGPRGSVVTGSGGAANDSRPMFNIEKLEWWPTAEQGPVVSMDAGNNVLFIGTANNFVIRWNVDTDELDEILVSTKKERIAKVFIDPTGSHGLISMESGVNYYLPARRDKPVILSKLKGPVVESVAWYTSSADSKSLTRALIGTPRGLLFDLVLEDGKERSCKKVFDLADSGADSAASQLISACHVEEFPPSAPTPPGGGPHPRFFVMIATPMRYYEFVGGPSIEAVFATQNPNLAFIELPGSLGYSELRFSTSKSPLSALPDSSSASSLTASSPSTSFAWLTAAGLFQGRLNFSTQSQPGERVVCDGNLVEYPVYPDMEALERLEAEGRGVGLSGQGPRLSPLSIALTEFHYLLLFRNRLIAINRLSKEIVYDCVLSRREIGVPQALCHDVKQDTIWLHTDRHVFEVEVSDEARDVWSIHLSQGRYDLAARYARTLAQRDRVLSAQADALFLEGKYAEAAEAYAVSNRSFEDVTLKFVGSHAQAMFHSPSSTAAAAAAAAGAGKGAGPSTLVPLPFASAPTVSPAAARVALKTYLRAKLRTIRNSDLTQLTMICVWLVELYLDTINSLAAPPQSAITISDAPAGSAAGGAAPAGANAAAGSGGQTSIHAVTSEAAARARARAQVQSELRASAVAELRDFLDEYADCLPRDATLDLLGSHGLLSEMRHFATVVNDIGFVLDHQVQHGQYDDALDILASKVSQAGRPEIAEHFYRFSPDLLVARPGRTVDILLKARDLDPLQLIPTFLRCGVKVYDDDTVSLVPNSPLTGPAGKRVATKGVPATETASAALSAVARTVAATNTGASSTALQRATEAKLAKLGVGSQVLSVGSSAAAAKDLRRQLASTSARAADGLLDAEEDDDDDDEDEAYAEKEPTEVSQQVCRYLSHVINEGGVTAPVIHHFYILLLSRLRSETPLLDFVTSSFETEPCFDVNFALRIAHSASPPMLRVCVLLLQRQCLYRDMVRLALRVDPTVAKDALVAASPQLAEKPELRRQLWLMLAQALIAAQWPARKVLSVLQEVESGIALEDILPSFPDITSLGELKNDVLAALGGYTDEIEDLKADVESLTAAATEIRLDLQRLSHRSGTITARHRCDLCAHPAALRGFLYFPCTHVFHEDCARSAATHYVNGGGIGGGGVVSTAAPSAPAAAGGKSVRKQAVIRQLLEDLDDDSPLCGLREAALAGTLTPEQEAAVLEEFAQSQCPLCGDIMINSVADPFVDPTKEADEVASWVI